MTAQPAIGSIVRAVPAPLHVLIIGGGIGGLTLAQGLKKSGVNVAVYERDRTMTDRVQGYRVHINPAGSLALHECLPPQLFEAFARTCGKPSRGIRFVTERMNVLISFDMRNPPQGGNGDRIALDRSVSRITLRRVLVAGLDDVVRFGKTFERYQDAHGSRRCAFRRRHIRRRRCAGRCGWRRFARAAAVPASRRAHRHRDRRYRREGLPRWRQPGPSCA